MREMKNSGVEWIGEIPATWTVSKLKNYIKCYDGRRVPIDSAKRVSGPYPYWGAGSITDYVDDYLFDEELILLGEDGAPFFDDTRPVAFLINEKIWANNHIHVIKPLPLINASFLVNYLNIVDYGTYINGSILSKLTQSNMNNISLVVPSLEEQHRIADFLDEKCAKIDDVIEKQKQVIEKLKEYKLSVITEAVTKGLDPTVSMKDSGVEWIGEIPEEWQVAKLSNLFDFLGGYAFNSDLYTSESNNLVVRIGNVKNDKLLIDANPVYISDELARQVGKFKLKSQDIVFTMTGTKGKRDYFYTKLLDESDISKKDLYLNQRVGCFRAKENIYAKYYCYLLKEPRILDSVFLYETGTANQGNLGIDSIGRTRVHMPSYEEQIEIAEYLHQKCSEIDSAILKKQAIVEKLTEYKKSLIYEVVTGKREV